MKPTRNTLTACATLLVSTCVLAALVATHPAPRSVPTGPAAAPAAPEGMTFIPAGTFTMGTEDSRGWPDEKPAHKVALRAFYIDTTEVTNVQFESFVKATGYVTTAEKKPDLQALMAQQPPGTPPPPAELLVPGALVFDGEWKWTPGASWKHPEGPNADIQNRMNHPVVQVSWDDAVAYAKWAGKRLPTEAEWEYAARGGLESAFFTWGDRPATPKDANYWQGHFPEKNTKDDGFGATAPVGSFPPNGYGLRDMAGNVWEWTADWYDRRFYAAQAKLGTVENPHGPEKSFDPAQPYTPLRVTRGGSFLCSDNFCFRYRPSARQGCSPDTAMNHTGFRCAKDAP
jgi:formylglycine-generating enzyme required for sulfatase activity